MAEYCQPIRMLPAIRTLHRYRGVPSRVLWLIGQYECCGRGRFWYCTSSWSLSLIQSLILCSGTLKELAVNEVVLPEATLIRHFALRSHVTSLGAEASLPPPVSFLELRRALVPFFIGC